MISAGSRTAAAALAALAFAGCSGNHVESVSEVLACTAPSGSLEGGASLDGWAGDFSLTMVASGEEERIASGRLTLHRQEGEFRQMPGVDGGMLAGVAVPLYGTTDIDLEAVGAIVLGDLGSDDPTSPGVSVIEQTAAEGVTITIRLGSSANQRGVIRFDGGYTALTVTAIGDGAFGGTWASGIQGPDASGYFCVVGR